MSPQLDLFGTGPFRFSLVSRMEVTRIDILTSFAKKVVYLIGFLSAALCVFLRPLRRNDGLNAEKVEIQQRSAEKTPQQTHCRQNGAGSFFKSDADMA